MLTVQCQDEAAMLEFQMSWSRCERQYLGQAVLLVPLKPQTVGDSVYMQGLSLLVCKLDIE